MKRTLILVVGLVLILALFVGCSNNAAKATPTTKTAEVQFEKLMKEPLTLKVTFGQNGDTVYGVGIAHACDAIAERTNGEVTFEIYPSGQLGKTAETLEQMMAGAPVVCSLGFDNTGEYIDELAVASAPYVFNDLTEVFTLSESEWMSEVEKKMYAKGFAPLGYGTLGYRHFISTKRIGDASDINGLIIRMGNSSLAQGFIKIMGGAPTTSSWSDNYSSLQQGIWDSCEASLDTLYNSSLYEVCDYLTLSGHFVTPTILTMGTQYWDKIPEEYQKIMREEFADAFYKMYEEFAASEKARIADFKAAGVEVINTDKSSFAAYVPDLINSLGLDSTIYNDIRAAIEN